MASLSLQDRRPAAALTYVEVGTLTRDDIYSLLDGRPTSAAEIRQAALKLAMQRARLRKMQMHAWPRHRRRRRRRRRPQVLPP